MLSISRTLPFIFIRLPLRSGGIYAPSASYLSLVIGPSVSRPSRRDGERSRQTPLTRTAPCGAPSQTRSRTLSWSTACVRCNTATSAAASAVRRRSDLTQPGSSGPWSVEAESNHRILFQDLVPCFPSCRARPRWWLPLGLLGTRKLTVLGSPQALSLPSEMQLVRRCPRPVRWRQP